jgi:hypothetical protein
MRWCDRRTDDCRFPPPWSAEVTQNCFIVRNADSQQLAYIYYENEPEFPKATDSPTPLHISQICITLRRLNTLEKKRHGRHSF